MTIYRYERNGIGPFMGTTEEERDVLDVEVPKGWTDDGRAFMNTWMSTPSEVHRPPLQGAVAGHTDLETLRGLFGPYGEKYLFSIGFEIYEYECEIIEKKPIYWIDVTRPFTKRKL